MSEEIKAKIEEKFSWNKAPSHYSNNESSCWSNGAIDGAEYGYGLAQEEIDRLRNSGVKHILEQANEIEVLKDTIESQAKEIESKKEVIVNMSHDWQKQLVAKDNEISQLKEALREYIEADLRADYMTSILTEEQQKRIQNLLNDKK